MSGHAAATSLAEPGMLDRGGTPALASERLLFSQRDQLGTRLAPEHRLMLAVLEDAVRVYQVDCLSTHTVSRLRFRETAEWFASDDTSSPFSFVTICELSGLDPDYVRAGLRRWKERHTTDAPRTGRVIPFRIRAVAGDFVASIRHAVETLSRGEDYPSVQQTAALLGISVRTLQRGLAARRTSHEALVAETRFAAAAALLERASGTILDIALSLGYSDHANFTRAFRRWAGCSPQEYRVRCGRRRHVDEHHAAAS